MVSLLGDEGARLAVIKHAKPGFDIDRQPGKDSTGYGPRGLIKFWSLRAIAGP